MKIKPSRRSSSDPLAAFWDTSAIVPLCCLQPQSSKARQAARTYARQNVWWGTPVEATGAVNRLVREGYLTSVEAGQALKRLTHMRRSWNEVRPDDEVRDRAEQLLGSHKLRAADALQLAAVLVWCRGFPRGHYFIVADNDLAEAADNSGFNIIRVT